MATVIFVIIVGWILYRAMFKDKKEWEKKEYLVADAKATYYETYALAEEAMMKFWTAANMVRADSTLLEAVSMTKKRTGEIQALVKKIRKRPYMYDGPAAGHTEVDELIIYSTIAEEAQEKADYLLNFATNPPADVQQEANPDRLLEATRAAELAAKAQQRVVNKARAVASLFDLRVALNETTGWPN